MVDPSISPVRRLRKQLLLMALLTFVGYYFADAAMDSLIFGEETFLDQLVTPNTHEVAIRLLHLFFQSLIVWIAWRLFVEGQKLEVSLDKSNQYLEQANAELIASNQRLKSFNYSLSHDLQSPLTVILTASQMMEDKDFDLAANLELVHTAIRDSSQQMQGLVDSMLLLAGLGIREIQIKQIDLSAQANGIAASLARKDTGRIVNWQIDDRIMVEGDTQLIAILLENLMNNAYKFTAQRDLAVISVRRRDGSPEIIEVRDNGIGFDPLLACEIFMPFSRLQAHSEFPGHGIGLATVQSIVELHHGRVWAESESDQGSCFCFTLGAQF